MNKYGIPSKFRIANHYYNVELCQFIDNGDSFGMHDNLKLLIQVAECMKEDDGDSPKNKSRIHSGMKYFMLSNTIIV